MPALIEVKEKDKINWHFYVCQKVIHNWGKFMENTRCVLVISTDKPGNCQISGSFKKDVRGHTKLNATW